MFNTINTIFVVAFIQALAYIISFLLNAWGAIFIVWGGLKAARRIFLVEISPWAGAQEARLERARVGFNQTLAFSMDFFIAGEVIIVLLQPTVVKLVILLLLTVIRILLSLAGLREKRAHVDSVIPKNIPTVRTKIVKK